MCIGKLYNISQHFSSSYWLQFDLSCLFCTTGSYASDLGVEPSPRIHIAFFGVPTSLSSSGAFIFKFVF